MKIKKYTAVLAMAAMVAAVSSGCGSPDKISNNLGGAMRDNSAYRYNYDYSGGDMGDGWTSGQYGDGKDKNGAAYWDYYGITNGTANDSEKNIYSTNKSTGGVFGGNIGYGTASNDAAMSKAVDINAAALAD